jgi:hypothetical protein
MSPRSWMITNRRRDGENLNSERGPLTHWVAEGSDPAILSPWKKVGATTFKALLTQAPDELGKPTTPDQQETQSRVDPLRARLQRCLVRRCCSVSIRLPGLPMLLQAHYRAFRAATHHGTSRCSPVARQPFGPASFHASFSKGGGTRSLSDSSLAATSAQSVKRAR